MKVKVIDIDNIFDDFLVKFISENKGKLTEKQWEEKIPVLYLEFFIEVRYNEVYA